VKFLEVERPSPARPMVGIIDVRDSGQSWAGEMGQRMEVEVVDGLVNDIGGALYRLAWAEHPLVSSSAHQS